MIYCVVPKELESELYDKLVAYYDENPNVTVIVDRREHGPDRRNKLTGAEFKERRTTRERRRARVTGTFPETDAPE
ncbi:MAG TPA: hypothetical protein VGL76_08385 [Gaiellaceae bacterium]|jgi:hypothetical protein